MYWVRKGIIGGSPIPYTEDELDEWKREGVKRILILPEEWEIEEAWGSMDYYFSLLREKGFEFLHEPIPDGYAPTFDQFLRIYEWLKKGYANLVHCVGGIGRTGTIIAGYLMFEEDLDSGEAIEEVRNYRPGAVQTYEQQLFLLQLEKMKEKWRTIL
ncbi:protein-tyrosine phosphatase family protein [Sulfurisphaera tokodaii]|uniref:Protein-tyrosine phosphatase n=2 Tax=Sulfurisphaera tokodaii TaxID=111955 RepID=F9VN40_SULTO|nr:dual specificity protein phosphatase family protein [Sulfurisphaera tokodaii]BAK54337.1 protein-tyrosine phosphatase [Sulfurisphaera tokodaii str. 7]HII74722.1 protein phosphatase [Sulfurisphaera tokodaii]